MLRVLTLRTEKKCELSAKSSNCNSGEGKHILLSPEAEKVSSLYGERLLFERETIKPRLIVERDFLGHFLSDSFPCL